MYTKEYHGYLIYSNGDIRSKWGGLLRQAKNQKGYNIVSLRVDGKSKTFTVHRLVALFFVDNPDNKPEVDHIDGNRSNNNYLNLRWVTHGENIAHSYKLNNRSAKGTNNARCILTEEQVHEICTHLQNGVNPAKIAKMGYSYGAVVGIVSKKNWKDIISQYTWGKFSPGSRSY